MSVPSGIKPMTLVISTLLYMTIVTIASLESLLCGASGLEHVGARRANESLLII